MKNGAVAIEHEGNMQFGKSQEKSGLANAQFGNSKVQEKSNLAKVGFSKSSVQQSRVWQICTAIPMGKRIHAAGKPPTHLVHPLKQVVHRSECQLDSRRALPPLDARDCNGEGRA